MNTRKLEAIHRCVSFFELLLDQFRGPEGELFSATQYLMNSATEFNYSRRASLIRIAKEKIESAESLASILLCLAQGNSIRSSPDKRKEELYDLLTRKSIRTDSYEIAKSYAEKINFMDAADSPVSTYSSDARKYLTKYLELEERQQATYQRLCNLTENEAYLGILQVALNRQLTHLDIFRKMLGTTHGKANLI